MKNLDYKIIEDRVIAEQIINKSKFISYLVPIQSEEEGKEVLRSIKKEHSKATHHCSALRVGEIERSNDDGEPASSAGLPMLQVLRGNKLQNVIAVVVRYFGGIELGVGGLIRAYGSSVTLAIQDAVCLSPQRVYKYRITFPYDTINEIETVLTGQAEIVDRNYDDLVHYDVLVNDPTKLDSIQDVSRGQGTYELLEETIEFFRG